MKKLALISVSFAGGFLSSYLFNTSLGFSQSGSSLITNPATEVLPKANKSVVLTTGNSSQNSEFVDKEEISLPTNLVSKYWPCPVFDEDVGSFDLDALESYGISRERSQLLQSEIKDILAQIRSEELQVSKFLRDKDGGQYFYIPKFPTVGAHLKDKLTRSVESAFGGKSGAAKAMVEGLQKHYSFNKFGENDLEMAIEDTVAPNGAIITSYHLKSLIRNGKLTINMPYPIGSKYVPEMFKRLAEKHNIPNG